VKQMAIVDARVVGGEAVDIQVSDRLISNVASTGTMKPLGQILDARGRLVVPGFVNAHLHLDKALTVGEETRWSDGTFQESIDMTLEARAKYTSEEMIERAEEVLGDSIKHGTTAMRAFADVGTVGGLLGVKTLCEIRDAWANVIDIQVAAFPQEGFLRDPGADKLVSQAMDQGADVVGAFPWFELSNELARRHIQTAFEIAKTHDADIHALVDDEPVAPNTRDLIQLAEETIDRGWEGRVTASHACGLSSYDDHLAERTMRLVADAGISIVSNTHVSLVAKCQRAPEPRPRGITRVGELMGHGVNVAAAQDDVADPYYPFGRGAMLEVAGYMAHVAQLYRPEDVVRVFEAITFNPARALRLENYGIAAGSKADLVVAGAGATPTQVLRLQAPPQWVLKNGEIVATTEVTSEVVRGTT
jgi:cytosine/creatinine deaminase